MPKCQALTKKQKPCPILTEFFDPDSSRFLCHVHHPNMTFRLQQEAKRMERQMVGRPIPKRARDYEEQLDELRTKLGLSAPNRRTK